MSESNNEDFLSRWSRLKNEQRDEQRDIGDNSNEDTLNLDLVKNNSKLQSSNTNNQGINNIDLERNKVEEKENLILTDKDMPDVKTLTEKSDYSGFLSPGVSEDLRKLALRKLFNSDYFHERDGLDDYDEEFTKFEKLGDIITADMRFQMEQEAKAKLMQESGKNSNDEDQIEQMLNSTIDEKKVEDELLKDDKNTLQPQPEAKASTPESHNESIK
jgi:hypothetical protein